MRPKKLRANKLPDLESLWKDVIGRTPPGTIIQGDRQSQESASQKKRAKIIGRLGRAATAHS